MNLLLPSRQILLDVDPIAALSSVLAHQRKESTMAHVLRLVGAATVLLVLSGPAHADPVKCQKTVIPSLLKYKKAYLKAHLKCLDAENVGKILGPCPDARAQLKIQTTNQKVVAKIAGACTMADLASLGYPANCAFETVSTGIEAQCAALPVTTPTEFAECLKCWKGAELAEYLAILYEIGRAHV